MVLGREELVMGEGETRFDEFFSAGEIVALETVGPGFLGSNVPVRADKLDMTSKKKAKNCFAAGGGSTNVENAMVDHTVEHVLDDRFPRTPIYRRHGR